MLTEQVTGLIARAQYYFERAQRLTGATDLYGKAAGPYCARKAWELIFRATFQQED